MSPLVRGRLREPSEAPSRGELVQELTGLAGGARVEQILSGELDAPVDDVQDHDEWVVVLAGRAALEVEGETIDLIAGEWVLLPAGVRHRVLRTQPGTNWLAVHGSSGALR